MTRMELDKVERLPELTPDERIVLVAELSPHPTILQVREKTIELLAEREIAKEADKCSND